MRLAALSRRLAAGILALALGAAVPLGERAAALSSVDVVRPVGGTGVDRGDAPRPTLEDWTRNWLRILHPDLRNLARFRNTRALV